MAKKPKTKKIKKSLRYKPFKSYQKRIDFIKNIIPYYYYIKQPTNLYPKHFLHFNNNLKYYFKSPNYYYDKYYFIPNKPIIQPRSIIKN